MEAVVLPLRSSPLVSAPTRRGVLVQPTAQRSLPHARPCARRPAVAETDFLPLREFTVQGKEGGSEEQALRNDDRRVTTETLQVKWGP